MSYNYLFDLSGYIDARITALTAGSMNASATPVERCRTEGRIDALRGFRTMLCRDIYPKLPKRLYRRMTATACERCLQKPDNCRVSIGDG